MKETIVETKGKGKARFKVRTPEGKFLKGGNGRDALLTQEEAHRRRFAGDYSTPLPKKEKV